MTDPNVDPLRAHQLGMTRRRFFGLGARSVGAGLGALALRSMAGASRLGNVSLSGPGPHFRPKAKRVIYLHMEGGPSQHDLYDYKPGLRQRFDQDLPDSIRQGQRLTTMTSGQARFPVAPSIFRFARQ